MRNSEGEKQDDNIWGRHRDIYKYWYIGRPCVVRNKESISSAEQISSVVVDDRGAIARRPCIPICRYRVRSSQGMSSAYYTTCS